MRDAALYTREFARENGTLTTNVHRISLEQGRAKIEATHVLGPNAALRIELSASGRLLIDDEYAPRQRAGDTRATDLRVLDAESMEQLGEVTIVGPQATRVDVQGEYALYGVEQGVYWVSLSNPTAPRVQAYIPVEPTSSNTGTESYGTGRGIVTSDGFVIEDSGVLKHYGFDVANLP